MTESPFSALESLCEVAAAVSTGENLCEDVSNDIKEVEAFVSVHDMIHGAISEFGGSATLQQIYTACQVRGRISYRRVGGSRLITQNENWKCQIRHALYTALRFRRSRDNSDFWVVTEPYAREGYQTTKVLVANDDVPHKSSGYKAKDKLALPPDKSSKKQEGVLDRRKLSRKARNLSPVRSKMLVNVRRKKSFKSKKNDMGFRKHAGTLCPVLGIVIPRRCRSTKTRMNGRVLHIVPHAPNYASSIERCSFVYARPMKMSSEESMVSEQVFDECSAIHESSSMLANSTPLDFNRKMATAGFDHSSGSEKGYITTSMRSACENADVGFRMGKISPGTFSAYHSSISSESFGSSGCPGASKRIWVLRSKQDSR